MAGPIGFGVFKSLSKQRRDRSERTPRTPGRGWWYFIVTATCLSWLTAGLLGQPTLHADDSMMQRLLSASIYYAATMGWQPIVAAWLAKTWREFPSALNGGLHWPRLRDVGLAIGIATGLAGTAMLVAVIVGESPFGIGAQLDGDSVLLAGAALLLLCLQALTEEYGWRGAPMMYAIERWGVRAGLVVHGLVWGAWYAPLFLLSSPTPVESLSPAGGFLITCLLLGIVFGWLRLRSNSIAPSAIANALLTIIAGLPLLLHEGSAGMRDAVFRWPGWPVIGVVAVLVLISRRRDVDTPSPAH